MAILKTNFMTLMVKSATLFNVQFVNHIIQKICIINYMAIELIVTAE